MANKKSLMDLGNRERQIVEAIYQLGEASVSDVLAALPDPPSYSAVRTMLGLLVQKGYLAYRHEGKKYLYRAVDSKQSAQRSMIGDVLFRLFGGRTPDAMAALLDAAGENLSSDDLARMQQMIESARKENR